MNTQCALLCLCLFAGACAVARPEQGSCILDAELVNQVTAKQINNLRCLAVPGQTDLYVISWTSGTIDRPFAHLRLARVRQNTTFVIQSLNVADGFLQEIEFTRNYTSTGGALLNVLTRFGAAAAEMRVIEIRRGALKVLFKVYADDVTTVTLRNTTVLVAHDVLNGLDAPDLYRYEGGKFVKCDLRYPEYYRGLLADQGLTTDSVIADDIAPQLSRLLYLSGDRKGAARVMERHKRK